MKDRSPLTHQVDIGDVLWFWTDGSLRREKPETPTAVFAVISRDFDKGVITLKQLRKENDGRFTLK